MSEKKRSYTDAAEALLMGGMLAPEPKSEPEPVKVQVQTQESQAGPEKPVSGRKKAAKRGRKKDEETRVTTSFTIDPVLLEKFKQISYLNKESASNVIDSLIAGYVEDHKEYLAIFEEFRKSHPKKKDNAH